MKQVIKYDKYSAEFDKSIEILKTFFKHKQAKQ